MKPAVGQRWSRKGETEIVVTSVSGNVVSMRQGAHSFTCSVADYERLSDAAIRNNLEHITEDEEI